MLYHRFRSTNEPEPNWQHVDAHGHVHRWQPHGDDYVLPDTLVLVEDAPATEEYPAVYHHECRLCGERVVPGTRSGQTRWFYEPDSYPELDGVKIEPRTWVIGEGR